MDGYNNAVLTVCELFNAEPFPDALRCHDCGGNGYGPILRDDRWAEINGPAGGFLCRPCMEHRLGRALSYTDVLNCPLTVLRCPEFYSETVLEDVRRARFWMPEWTRA